MSLLLDCAWDSRKLLEGPHDWVGKMVTTCRGVWDFMMLDSMFADTSSLLREQVGWRQEFALRSILTSHANCDARCGWSCAKCASTSWWRASGA